MAASAASAAPHSATWRDYFALGKPRVVSLILFTALVGMLLSGPGLPPLAPAALGLLGIALAASAAGAYNQVIEQRRDALMARTRRRPVPSGQLSELQATAYATTLASASMLVLGLGVNLLTATLTFFALIGYSAVYTVWLKRSTPQNIVIGGAAGAIPPVLGWSAVTGTIGPEPLLLFLIIFLWTPPHFWPLAIDRREEYAEACIPMLPVVYGVPVTRLYILTYTVVLVAASLLPVLVGMSGALYAAGAAALGAGFLYHAAALALRPKRHPPMRVFRFSITYLAALFALLLLDHFARAAL